MDDPEITHAYGRYLQHCLECVVTGVRFMAHAVQSPETGAVIAPDYLPSRYREGLEHVYDPEIAAVASTRTYHPDNQEKFVILRRSHMFSMRPFEAYRQHFDRMDAQYDSDRLPVHGPLTGYFYPERSKFYAAIESPTMMRMFCRDGERDAHERQSLAFRCKSAIFHAEALASHVRYYCGDVKKGFLQSVQEHCAAIERYEASYYETAESFKQFLLLEEARAIVNPGRDSERDSMGSLRL